MDFFFFAIVAFSFKGHCHFYAHFCYSIEHVCGEKEEKKKATGP